MINRFLLMLIMLLISVLGLILYGLSMGVGMCMWLAGRMGIECP